MLLSDFTGSVQKLGLFLYNLYLSYLNCAKDYADIKDRSETLKYIDLAKRHFFNYKLIIAYFYPP